MGTYKDSHFKKHTQINYSGVVVASVFFVVFLLACMPFLGVVNKLVLGIFGIVIYPLCLLGMLIGYAIATNRKFNMPTRNLVLLILSSILFVALLHAIFHSQIVKSYGEKLSFSNFSIYLKDIALLKKGLTVGGIIFGIIVYPFSILFGLVGACIIFAISMCVSVGFLVDYYITLRGMKNDYISSKRYESSSRLIPSTSSFNEPRHEDTFDGLMTSAENKGRTSANVGTNTKFMNYQTVNEENAPDDKIFSEPKQNESFEIKEGIVKLDDEDVKYNEAMSTLYGKNIKDKLDDGYDKDRYNSLKDYIMSPYIPPVFLKNNNKVSDNEEIKKEEVKSESHIDLMELSKQNPTDAFERFRASMNENREMLNEGRDEFKIEDDNKKYNYPSSNVDTRDLPHTKPMEIDNFGISQDNNKTNNLTNLRLRDDINNNSNAQYQRFGESNKDNLNSREFQSDNSSSIMRNGNRFDEINSAGENNFDRSTNIGRRSSNLWGNTNNNIDTREDNLNSFNSRELRSNLRDEFSEDLRSQNSGLNKTFGFERSIKRDDTGLDSSESITNRNFERNERIQNRTSDRPQNRRVDVPKIHFVDPKPERDSRFPSLGDFDSEEDNSRINTNRDTSTNLNSQINYEEPRYLDERKPVRDSAFEEFVADNFNREKSGRGKDLRPRKTPERNARESGFNFSNNTNSETLQIGSPFKDLAIRNNEIKQDRIESKNSVGEIPQKDIHYNAPPTSILVNNSTDPSEYGGDYESKVGALEGVLESFKIPAKVINVIKGPTFSKFELAMPQGIPVKKILSYDGDIAMALMSKSGVRIEAPIPGKNAVGIEIPNDKRATVGLREILESKEFRESKSILPVAIGKNIYGETVVTSMAKMVHLLVAGSTGSGKSVFLHNLILSLMYKSSPAELRFIMIDPKRVEFGMYNGMPHLMLPNVVTECDKAINAFTWAVKEMDRRYKMFQNYQAYGVNNIEKFNACEAVKSGQEQKIPYIVVIVDELADLMMVGKRDVEGKIQRIAQLGRACGIHLVIATQRPSVEVVTGTIKSNLPTRIAFSLTSFIDSRTILDEGGAEKLLGKGDMLYSPQDAATATRLQSAYTETTDIKKVIEYIKENNEIYFDEEAEKEIMSNKEDESKVQEEQSKKPEDDGPDYDELLPEALKYFIETNSGSTSMIQRRFRVGYARAARILDQMEVAGFVSPANGSKARNIYITMEQYENMFGGDSPSGDDSGDDGYNGDYDDYDE